MFGTASRANVCLMSLSVRSPAGADRLLTLQSRHPTRWRGAGATCWEVILESDVQAKRSATPVAN
jgi:hypothetical protein